MTLRSPRLERVRVHECLDTQPVEQSHGRPILFMENPKAWGDAIRLLAQQPQHRLSEARFRFDPVVTNRHHLSAQEFASLN